MKGKKIIHSGPRRVLRRTSVVFHRRPQNLPTILISISIGLSILTNFAHLGQSNPQGALSAYRTHSSLMGHLDCPLRIAQFYCMFFP